MSRSVQTYLRMQRISQTLQHWPRLYIEVQKLRHRKKIDRIVTRQHALMIEGFPRSGNSFAVQAFKQANPELVGRIATHLHTSAHIIRATQLGVPGMVLVRDPTAAVTSMVALGTQTGRLDLSGASHSNKDALIAQVTRRYTAFHENLLDLSDRLMIVRFEDVTTDFGAVIDALNQRFGTRFSSFEHTSEAVAEIFKRPQKRGKIHLSPNAFRDEIKQSLSAHYAAPENAKNRQAAEQAYAACLALSVNTAVAGRDVWVEGASGATS